MSTVLDGVIVVDFCSYDIEVKVEDKKTFEKQVKKYRADRAVHSIKEYQNDVAVRGLVLR